MNHVQIQQLLVITKYMNLTKAAKELYITQPALSHSLSKIESELGFKIFFRDSNRLILTDEGRKILKDIGKINDAYDEMLDHARLMNRNRRPKIVLGFSGSLIAFYTMFAYGLFPSWEGIPIEKVFASKEIMESMLKNGTVDLAISFPIISGSDINYRILLRDPYRLAIPAGHPLLRKPKIKLEDLEAYTILSLTTDNPFATALRDNIQNKNSRLKFKECSFSEFHKLMTDGAKQKDLLSITTKKQLSLWFDKTYRSIPISDFQDELTTGMSWMSNTNFPYEYKGLLDEIESKFDRIYYANYKRPHFK